MKKIKNIFIMLSIFCLMMSGSFAVSEMVAFEIDSNGDMLKSDDYGVVENTKVILMPKSEFQEKYKDYFLIQTITDKDTVYYEPRIKEEYEKYLGKQQKREKEELEDDMRHEQSMTKKNLVRSSSSNSCSDFFDFDGYNFERGEVLLKEYDDNPSWAYGYFDYHHAGIITTNGNYRKSYVMEARGVCEKGKKCTADDEIAMNKIRYSDFGHKGQVENGECNLINKIDVLEVEGLSEKEITETIKYSILQDEKRYNMLPLYGEKSKKSNDDYFYCSKLVWKSFKEGADIDIDEDGGFYVTPGDIYDDDDTNRIKRFRV